MLYTSNLGFGWKVLETKLSLLILPLIYSAYIDTTKKKLQQYLRIFVYGCIVYAVLCFGYACYAYYKPIYTDLYGVLYDLGFNYFYYDYLSLFFHPSYTAMYSVFALLIITVGVKQKIISINWKVILSIALLTVFILFLSSKAGWFALILLGIYVIKLLVASKKNIQSLYFIIPILMLFFALNIYFAPNYAQRLPQIDNIIKAIMGKDQDNKTVTSGSDGNAARVFIWKTSLELFSENIFIGSGTGDAKDELMKKYQEKEMTAEYKYKLNCHNQYLSTAVSVGIIGLIVLLLALFYPLILSIRQQDYILGGFIILFIINFFFESILETQAGLVYYAFFNTLLCSTFVKNNSN